MSISSDDNSVLTSNKFQTSSSFGISQQRYNYLHCGCPLEQANFRANVAATGSFWLSAIGFFCVDGRGQYEQVSAPPSFVSGDGARGSLSFEILMFGIRWMWLLLEGKGGRGREYNRHKLTSEELLRFLIAQLVLGLATTVISSVDYKDAVQYTIQGTLAKCHCQCHSPLWRVLPAIQVPALQNQIPHFLARLS